MKEVQKQQHKKKYIFRKRFPQNKPKVKFNVNTNTQMYDIIFVHP